MIADRIKQLREECGLSQAQLAKRLHVTRSSVNAWEMGLSMPTIQYVVEMAKLFRIRTDFLLGLEEEQTISLEGLSEEEISLLYGLLGYFHKRSSPGE
ncbi:HTH-type transcriptional regulator immR [uncultured Ruminococcus sp.]|uniref:Helix-turn-helix domain-containing protein n=1 Tax=Massiliimalia timonensis TaxID=1987501 RepID=A0A8J6P984_9FIRM|nr:helix-turn-helix domain-containing protein [Massiliimalia timonensis]MBC8611654.1 helix-turn-helix domain-containing protein [Massiliimalia timonensis]MBS7175844.1 helix-turn-helix domain-containing protein [Clostridiales bacterium]SCH57687.1 HTH-type transcriptional regulator immR [uncultured Clostridium sp.]SCH70236.1 HTH-type transcriptional regulator immR [uncultured Ruminococcus sp.]